MNRETELLLDIEERRKYYHVPGIGIAAFQNGKMQAGQSFGVIEARTTHKVTEETLFHACSISKMATAIGVLRLVQDGILELDADVNQYLTSWRIPDNKYTELKKVTLRQLLAHQGGFVDPEGSFGILQKNDQVPKINEIINGYIRYNPNPLQVTCEPESEFSYSDAGYCLVEQIVEDVTGESFDAVMERVIVAPLNLKRTTYLNPIKRETENSAAAGHDQRGFLVEGKRAYYPYHAAAGLWTTPSELALLTLEVTSAWNGSTHSILLPDKAHMMLAGFGCDKAVGLGVFVPQAPNEPYFVSKGWGIGFQCMLLAYPRLQSGIVVMTNSDPGKPQNEALVGEVIQNMGKENKWPGF
jgi:CubicO group peptidase (beta-lactamase class C family)